MLNIVGPVKAQGKVLGVVERCDVTEVGRGGQLVPCRRSARHYEVWDLKGVRVTAICPNCLSMWRR